MDGNHHLPMEYSTPLMEEDLEAQSSHAQGKKGHITCHGCAREGHFASKCPDLLAEHESTQSATTLLMSGSLMENLLRDTFEFLQDGQNGVTCQIGQDG
jgi:hypothetical protein